MGDSGSNFAKGLTVRDRFTSSGMSFEEQLQYGVSILEKYGRVVIENGMKSKRKETSHDE